jgi:DNA transformation protein
MVRRSGDASFLAFVLDQLGGRSAIESRAMFGGHGLYRDGTFFGIVFRGRLYFRTSEATRPEYEAQGMKRFRPGERQTLRSYYEVPADVLEDPAEVARWARAAAAEPPARTGAGSGRHQNSAQARQKSTRAARPRR